MRCALFLLAAAMAAQAQPGETFGVQSRIVLAPVTVTDAKGNTVDGLEAADFRVLDNGRPRRVDVDTLATGVAPIALVMAVQSAGISAPVLEKTRKIAAMIHPLVTGERGCAALVSFSERVDWLAECTSDAGQFTLAFDNLRPGEAKAARMLDAALAAIGHLSKRPRSRRVLLLISESRDRSSEATLEAVVLAAQHAAVTVYSATYSAFKTAWTTKAQAKEPKASRSIPPRYDPRNPPRRDREPMPPPPEQRVDILGGFGELARLGKPNTAQVLATQTGGDTFPFTRQRGLESAIEKLGAELHSQYILSFAPEDPEPGYHRLEIKLVRPGAFSLRSRPGYWVGNLP